MENRERAFSRFDSLISNIRETFAIELEERLTQPGSHYKIEPTDIETIRNGGRIPSRELGTRDLLIRIGQDYRLTPNEIDLLLEQLIDENIE